MNLGMVLLWIMFFLIFTLVGCLVLIIGSKCIKYVSKILSNEENLDNK